MRFFGVHTDQAGRQIRRRLRIVRVRLRPFTRRACNPLIALAAFGVAYVVLGAILFMAGSQLGEAAQRAATARVALARPAPPADDLVLALRGWEFLLASAQSSRVAPLPDSELVDRTLGLAEAAGVDVIDAGTRAEHARQIDGRDYRAAPYAVRVRGPLPEIEAFLHAFETGLTDTLEVTGSIITVEDDAYVLAISSVVYSHLPEAGGAGGGGAAAQAAPAAVSAAAGDGRK